MATRLFHFSDGKSNKFWQITVEGSTHAVQWGRIGTAGQAQTKEFGSDADARAAAEKLIAEKVRKGYVEQNGAAPPPPVAARPAAPSKPVPAAEDREADAALTPAAEPEVPSPSPISNRGTYVSGSAQISLPDQPERRLDLTPMEWAVATWRPRTPLPLPEAPPFELSDAMARLRKVAVSAYPWTWQWQKARISPTLCREEAHFWLQTMVRSERYEEPKELFARLEKGRFDGRLTVDQVFRMLKEQGRFVPSTAIRPLFNLVNLDDLILRVVEEERNRRADPNRRYEHDWMVSLTGLSAGFRLLVLPYLADEQIASFRDRLRPALTTEHWPTGNDGAPEFFFAAMVGLSEELLPVVESWPDDEFTGSDYADYSRRPQEIIMGLASPALVEHHIRRLRLTLRTEEYIGGWLAHTEFSALDLPRDAILAQSNKEEAEKLLAALGRAHAPETAPVMLELMLGSKAPRSAREWLEAHPVETVTGLLPVAAGRGRLAEAAVDYLRSMKRKGHEELLRAAVDRLDGEAAAALRAEILEHTDAAGVPFTEADTPEWLRTAVAEFRRGKKAPAITWVAPSDLPPVQVGDRQFLDAQIEVLLQALSLSKLESPHPFVLTARANADRASLDRFAWRLFERWLSEGGPSKDRWAMQAVGLLGTDASALKLAPMIRAWPGESQHPRAVAGLECLRAIATDTALMQINGIAQKVPFKGLKTKAGECMEAIATDRGLSRAELEDRIVPDCDLDERGTRVFDFGPRQFRMVLGEGMKPMLRDADGKVKPDLPKPTTKDDPALAQAALDEWKLLKKQVAEVAKVQAVRLEQAMVTGRRWKREEFEALLVRHPLMTNLVRLVVWGAYDAAGKRRASFRITEDLTAGDANDDVFDLSPYLEVGVIHPLHLTERERAQWGELLSDYEIVPPFPQLGRPLYGLTEAERGERNIARFKDKKIDPRTLVFTLDKFGWERGVPQDGGGFWSHSKPFVGANLTALVEYEEGVAVGWIEGAGDQEVTTCAFLSGLRSPRDYPEAKDAMPLDRVDPVAISEVLNDLTQIMAKAK